MYSEEFYNAMVDYCEKEMDMTKEMMRKTLDRYTADEWSHYTGLKFSPQRLAAMAKKGMVKKAQDKRYYGDNLCRYFPIV